MAEEAKVLRIVVASPGDVEAERKLVPAIVEEVNRGAAEERGLALKVARWEKDAYPGFHSGGPQALIDSILRIPECDIFIGIFWKRFGTPVADAKSGTEHEYKLAYETWKKIGRPQIFFYFNEKAYSPKSKEETDQWGLVLEFKKNFPKEGLWLPYKGKTQFRELLRDHLEAYLREKFPLGEGQPSPPPAATALHQLPPPPGDFTGRKQEIDEILSKIEKGTVISGLHGMGGVGKTALALVLAEKLAARYPDAQFYLDLKGTSPQPLTPAEAMAHVIRGYQPDSKIPDSNDELSARYRSVLHGQCAILLMDNARDAAQVTPLLPPAGCLLLVTSRWHFVVAGLFPKNLDTLPPEDARKLLLAIAPRIDGQTEEIARLCGFLPLALRLAGSAVASHPDLTPSEYARRLKDAQKRLELVDASLGLSYDLLSLELQKRFARLAVFPESFEPMGAAAVWEIELDPAREALSELVAYSLVQWNEAVKRYKLHDLVRDFAHARLTSAERAEAERRHAAHYVEVARAANKLYLEGGENVIRGLALFDAGWANIQAGQAWAASRAGGDEQAARLCSAYPDAGVYCLDLRQHPRQQIGWREDALAAARRLKNRGAEGAHLGNLGIAYKNLGETRRAIEFYEQCLVIHREAGDRRGEGQDLGNLGIAYSRLGETRRAIEFYEKRLAIAREIGDRRGEGNALGNLGNACLGLGETRRAIEFYEQCLVIHREAGDRRGEGQDLGNLGIAYKNLGETRRAIEFYEQALAIDREIQDRRGEGSYLFDMSLALDDLGQRAQAIAHAEAALKILEQIEDPNADKVRKKLAEWGRT